MAISFQNATRRGLAIGTALAVSATGLIVASSPAAATPTWTTPVIAVADTAGDEQNNTASLSFDGTRMAWRNMPTFNTGTAMVIDRTGGNPPTFGSSTTLSSDSSEPRDPMISRDGNGVIWRAEGASGNKDRATGGWQADTSATAFNNNGADYLTVANDASRVAYLGPNSEVFVQDWNADGTAGTQTTVDTGGYTPYLSGDGQTVAYSKSVGGTDRIFAASAPSWTPTQISSGSDPDDGGVFGISYDGTKLIWMSDDDYYVWGSIKTGGAWGPSRVLTADAVKYSSASYFSFGQDGSFSYKSDDDGTGHAVLFRDGDWEADVQVVSGEIGHPSISDDGSTFAYRDYADNRNIKVIMLEDGVWSSPIAITSSETSNYTSALTIAGNGRAVAFRADGPNIDQDIFYSEIMSAEIPAGVSAVKASETSAAVTWDPVSADYGATTSYEAQAFVNGSAVAGKTCTLTAPFSSPLTCTVTGLPAGTYEFRVRATNAIGTSAWSNPSNSVKLESSASVTAPTKPRALKVVGGPNAKKYKVSWKTPTNPGDRPTEYFRFKLNQRTVKNLIINKKLNASVLKYSFTRKFLLKNSKRTRGDMGAALGYRVRVEAFNSAGGGPISARTFVLKL